MILKGLSEERYQLAKETLGDGAEGDVYSVVNDPDDVVKVYHKDRITRELEQKLLYMCNQQPKKEISSQIAWPKDIAYNLNGEFQGFVMPRLKITNLLIDIYKYPPQLNISYEAKIVIAQNICAVISAIHEKGFVFGDFNPKNIGVNIDTCHVAFLDTDSYHIVDGSHTYRCVVGYDGYVAPELLKKCEPYKTDAYVRAPLPTFTRETDNFALAIHIFKLLMNGFTPFNGIPESVNASTASPGTGNQAIKRDNYCFKPGNKPQSPAVPPLSVLPNEIANLFTRAFIYGRTDPTKRPVAAEWHKALLNYENSLVSCPDDRAHMYRKGLRACPWCEADRKFNALMGGSVAPQSAFVPSLPQKTFSGAVVAPPVVVPPVNTGYSPSSSTSGYPSTGSSSVNYGSAGTQYTGYGASGRTVSSYPAASSSSRPAAVNTSRATKQRRRERWKTRVKIVCVVMAVLALIILGASVYTAYDMSNRYAQAEALLAAGNYDDAAVAFRRLKDYRDSAERLSEAYYAKAETYYAKAETLLTVGDLQEAALAFGKAGDYKDARERSLAAWDEVAVRDTISGGSGYAVGLKADGTVISTGSNNYGRCDVERWTDIVAVSAGYVHSVGLKSDGTVVATGDNGFGQCDVDDWTDIVAVDAGGYCTVGLKMDGTVLAVGKKVDGVSSWRDIVAVAAGEDHCVGLKIDGTIVFTGRYEPDKCNVREWENIIAISNGYALVGLKANGNIVTTGWTGPCFTEAESWTDVVAVSAGSAQVVGLKSDGTVVAVGYGVQSHIGEELADWSNIVAVSSGVGHVMGLKSDGTVVVDWPPNIGMNWEETWTDIRMPK